MTADDLTVLADSAMRDHARLERERATLQAQLSNAEELRLEALDVAEAACDERESYRREAERLKAELSSARRTIAELTARLGAVEAATARRKVGRC